MQAARRLLALSLAAIWFSAPVTAPAQPVSNARSPLGIGLSGILDYSSESPFIDLMKSSRAWTTACAEGADCPFDTGEADKIALDEHGWVTRLPKPDDATVRFRGVESVVFIDAGPAMAGRYVVLYDGEGRLTYSGAEYDAQASRPGRHVLTVGTSSPSLFVAIRESDPRGTGAYVRNIRVVREENEDRLNRGEMFNPVFLEKIKPFGTIRFMEWMNTNRSTQKEWTARPKLTDVRWSLNGAPVEAMVALANTLHADPWFNMPHLATDEYVASFAELVEATLAPALRPYVEYSNETWNWAFPQTQAGSSAAEARWGKHSDGFMQWHGMKSATQCDAWRTAFHKTPARVQCVIATQTGYRGLEKGALTCPLWVKEGHKPCHAGLDVYAVTAYTSGSLGSPANAPTVRAWLSEPDGGFASAFSELRTGLKFPGYSSSLADVTDDTRYHRSVAGTYGLRLVAYEGGQHIVGIEGVEQDDQLTAFFHEMNRRPEMGSIYKELLTLWKDNGGELFVHFVGIARSGRYGSWGALEHLGQSGSPKYDALLSFAEKNPCWWKDCTRQIDARE